MTSNKYATRIQALLDKAESTTSEAEAHALTAKAAELITKYGIEEAELASARRLNGTSIGEVTERPIWFAGVYHKALLAGAYQIVLTFEKTLFATRSSPRAHRDFKFISDGDTRKGQYLHLYGYESDVAQAELLISSITLQAMSGMRSWWDRQSFWHAAEEGIYLRRSYIEGYFLGAAQKIRDSRLRTIRETSQSGTIALRDRASEVQDWVAQNLNLVNGRASYSKSYECAVEGGYLAGSRADVGNARFDARTTIG